IAPTQSPQALHKRRNAGLGFRVIGGTCHKHADAPRRIPLRTRRERPRRRAADERNELAPLHSITSSARASSAGGMVRPSGLAVGRLITSSSLVGNSTGRSPGLAPFRTLTT